MLVKKQGIYVILSLMKKTIVHIVTTMNMGGLESLIISLFKELHLTYEFVFIVQKRGYHHFFDDIERLGGRIYPVYRETIIDYITYLIRLNRTLKRINANVIHSHIDTLSSIPLMIAKRNNYKIRIAHSHNSNQELNLYYPLKVLFKSIIKFYATELIACSREAGNWMFGKSNYHYIPNAIDTVNFRFDIKKRLQIRKQLNLEKNFVIGHVGRFNHQKNHIFLIEIFKEISIKNTNAKLILIGEGPLKDYIIAKIRDLSLSDRVIVLSPVGNVNYYYSAFDYFIFPSLYEGMSLALIEAQVAGLKCLVSDNITLDCLNINNSRSLNLKLSQKQWADAVLFDRYSRQSNEGLENFIVNFDIKVYASRIVQLYEADC